MWYRSLTKGLAPHDLSARQVCELYHGRWGIEVQHNVLKSGCRLEARQRESAAQLWRCLAVDRVIAWRLLSATMLSRAMPAVPCTALLEPEAWQALYCSIHVTATPPAKPPTLREVVHWIGRLGGFLARRSDGEPGVTVWWKGFQHLTALTYMHRISRPPLPKRQVECLHEVIKRQAFHQRPSSSASGEKADILA